MGRETLRWAMRCLTYVSHAHQSTLKAWFLNRSLEASKMFRRWPQWALPFMWREWVRGMESEEDSMVGDPLTGMFLRDTFR